MADSSKSKDTPKAQPKLTEQEESNLKLVSAVGYLGILFLIPLLTQPKSKFAVFHANQGLLLLIAGVIVSIVGSIIPFIGWFLILPLGSLFIFVLFIMGVINAFNGKMKRLPLIGGYDLLSVQE